MTPEELKNKFTIDHEDSVYGYCPICGDKGSERERRPNGNDTCVNGHVYPSKNALLDKPDTSGPKDSNDEPPETGPEAGEIFYGENPCDLSIESPIKIEPGVTRLRFSIPLTTTGNNAITIETEIASDADCVPQIVAGHYATIEKLLDNFETLKDAILE